MVKPPKSELEKYDVYVSQDTCYAAHARLLQSKWRFEKGIPIGEYKGSYGKYIALGNYIQKEKAFNDGSNFLTSNIKRVVKETLDKKEIGAKIEKNRLYTNLLSSQPLAFNLFGELSLDLDLATIYFDNLFPNRIKKVTKIIFEHSDGRGNLDYTGDRSAFDVFIEFMPIKGKCGFIGIEVKYSESLKDVPSTHKQRYEELSLQSNIFKPSSFSLLKKKPVQQIWRDHLLSIAHLKHPNNKYDTGFFVYLYPKDNDECRIGLKEYIIHFNSYSKETGLYDEVSTGFYPRFLEDFVESLISVYSGMQNNDWTYEFKKRYLGQDFEIDIKADFVTFREQIIRKFGSQYYEQQEIFFSRAVEFANKGHHNNALIDAKFALELGHYSNDKVGLPYLIGFLSQLYCDMGKISNAKQYYELGLKMLDQEDSDYSEVSELYELLKDDIESDRWKEGEN